MGSPAVKRPGPLTADPAKVADWKRRTARPLPLTSKQRREQDARRKSVRRAIIARDRVCQVAAIGQLHGYDVGPCQGVLSYGHRRKASQGGAYTMANGTAQCVAHNCALEQNADLARWAHCVGLVVRRGDAEWASLGQG